MPCWAGCLWGERAGDRKKIGVRSVVVSSGAQLESLGAILLRPAVNRVLKSYVWNEQAEMDKTGSSLLSETSQDSEV